MMIIIQYGNSSVLILTIKYKKGKYLPLPEHHILRKPRMWPCQATKNYCPSYNVFSPISLYALWRHTESINCGGLKLTMNLVVLFYINTAFFVVLQIIVYEYIHLCSIWKYSLFTSCIKMHFAILGINKLNRTNLT